MRMTDAPRQIHYSVCYDSKYCTLTQDGAHIVNYFKNEIKTY